MKRIAKYILPLLLVTTLLFSCNTEGGKGSGNNGSGASLQEPEKGSGIHMLILTSDDENVTKQGTRALYYKPVYQENGDVDESKPGVWYTDAKGTKPATSAITLPEKSNTISFAIPLSTAKKPAPRTLTNADYTFQGYSVNGVKYIQADGKIDTQRAKINEPKSASPVKVEAVLSMPINEGSAIDLSQVVKEAGLDSSTSGSTSVIQIVGWSLDGGLTEAVSATGIYEPKKSVVTLTAMLKSGSNHKVTFDYKNATSMSYITLYYNASNNSWSKDVEESNKLSGDTVVDVNKVAKKRTINFDLNVPEFSGNDFYETKKNFQGKEKTSYSFTLEGFYKKGAPDVIAIDNTGKLVEPIGEDVTLVASWTASPLTLPEPIVPNGYTFEGWKIVGKEDSTNLKGSYTPDPEDSDVQNDTITFKAVWSSQVYEFNFTPNTENSEKGTTTAYYWKDHGWYSDKNLGAENKIEKIELPTKVYTSVFNYNLPGIPGTSQLRKKDYTYTFESYKATDENKTVIVRADGYLASNSTVNSIIANGTGPYTLNAVWKDYYAIDIPGYVENMAIGKTSSTFVEWNAYVPKDAKTILDGKNWEDKSNWNAADVSMKKPAKDVSKWVEENYIVYYEAVWSRTDLLMLKLDRVKDASNTPGYLYYAKNNGWLFDDENSSNVINNNEPIFNSESGLSLDPVSYTVTYHLNVPEAAKAEVNIQDTKEEIYSKAYYGHTLDGKEFISRDGKFMGGSISIEEHRVEESNQAVAQWQSGSPLKGAYKSDELTISGYTFVGWTTDANPTASSTIVDITKEHPESNLEYYAYWTPNVYKVSLEKGDATKDNTLKAIWYRTNDGWYKNADCTGDKITSILTSVVDSSTGVEEILPKKEYTIYFALKDPNDTYPNLLDSSAFNDVIVNYAFEKYIYGEDGHDLTNADGSIKDDVKITQSCTAKPVFSVTGTHDEGLPDESVVLASIKGYKYESWKTANGINIVTTIDEAVELVSTENKDIDLYPNWVAKVSALTLENTIDESGNPYKIWYKTDAGWFKEEEASTPFISLSDIQSQTFNVKFFIDGGALVESEPDAAQENNDSQDAEPDIEIPVTYSFKNYTVNGEEVINSKGAILSTVKIYEDSLAKLNWDKDSSVGVETPPEVEWHGHIFQGWATAAKGDTSERVTNFVTFPYKPGVDDNPPLHAWWKEIPYTKLTLDPNGATNIDRIYTEIYNKPGTTEWYERTENGDYLPSDEPGFPTIGEYGEEDPKRGRPLPEKVWIVNAVVGNDTVDGDKGTKQYQSRFTFMGYPPYIPADGSVVGLSITADETVKASWSTSPSPIGLLDAVPQDPSQKVFKGWSLKNDNGFDQDSIIKQPLSFVPTSNNINIYPVWEYKTYTLELYDEYTTTGTPTLKKTLYYKNGVYYSDSTLKNPVTTVESNVVQKTYSLKLNTKDSTIYPPQIPSRQARLTAFTSQDGNIEYVKYSDDTKTLEIVANNLQANVKAYAKFDDSVSFNINGIKRVGYNLLGWDESSNKLDDPTYKADAISGDTEVGNLKSTDTTLYAVWKPNVYEVKLDPPISIDGETPSDELDDSNSISKIYYNVGDGEWYRDAALANHIVTSLGAPVDKYTVNFEFNYNAAKDVNGQYTTTQAPTYTPVKTKRTFKGYGNIINADGTIATGAKVSGNTTVYALWGDAVGVTLPNPKPEWTGYEFVGWSETQQPIGSANANATIGITGTFVPNKETTTLYASWKANVYKLTISAPYEIGENENIIKQGTQNLWYKTGEGWFKDATCTQTCTLDGNGYIVPQLPRKYITINYSVQAPGRTTITEDSVLSEFPIRGLMFGSDNYIDENGKGTLSKVISSDITVTPIWGDQASVTLAGGEADADRYSVKGYIFKGWSDTSTQEGASQVTYEKGLELKPAVATPNAVLNLYGVWEKGVYALNLNLLGRTNTTEVQSSYTIYYKTGTGWYRTVAADAVSGNNITNVADVLTILPEKKYTIQFRYNNTIYSDLTKFVNYPLEGFVQDQNSALPTDSSIGQQLVIDSGLNLQNYEISEHTSLIVKFADTPSDVPQFPQFPEIQDVSLENMSWQWGSSGNKLPDEPIDDNVGENRIYDLKGKSTIYVLTLTAPDSTDYPTIDPSTGALTYPYQTSVYYQSKRWYNSIDESGNPILETDRIDSDKLPKKQTRIKFDLNLKGEDETLGGINIPDTKVNWTFQGYVDKSNSSKTYVERSGVLVLPDSEELTSNVVALATFAPAPTGIDLTLADYVPQVPAGWYYKFKGWAEAPNATTAISGVYKPTSTLDITLYAIWEPQVYKLTLEAADATNTGFTDAIYYKYNVGWYTDEACTSQVVSIVRPRKVWTVKYHRNLEEYYESLDDKSDIITTDPDSVSVEFEFKGYKLTNGPDDSVTINDSSSIRNLRIKEDSTAVVQWGDVENDKNPLPHLTLPHLTEKGLQHVGWDIDPKATTPHVTLESKYQVKDDDRTKDDQDRKTNEVNFYAIWTSATYKLELSTSGTATSTDQTVALYYETEYPRNGVIVGGWYKDEEKTQPLGKLADGTFEAIVTPRREYVISFNLEYGNSTESKEIATPSTVDPLRSTYTFTGYYANTDAVIDENGVLKTGYRITSDLTLSVKWGDQSSIRMPIVSSRAPGYTFIGWSDNADRNGTSILEGSEYSAALIKSDMTFYANWSPKILQLVLNTPYATSINNTSVVYYKMGTGWYLDRATTNGIKAIDIPKREYKVTYEISTSEGVVIPEGFSTTQVSAYDFKGYSITDALTGAKSTVIDDKGNFIGQITEDSQATVDWSYEQRAIVTPDDSLITRKDYRIDEWYDKSDSTNVVEPGTQYRPTKDITLLPRWVRVFKSVTLKTNLATNTSQLLTKIYNREGKWYADEAAAGTPITKLPYIPQRTALVTFDTQEQGVTPPANMTASWTSDGYTITTTDAQGQTIKSPFIDKDGNILSPWLTMTLTEDWITNDLVWTKSETPEFSITSDQDVFKFGKKFLGWSLEKKSETYINSTWRPIDPLTTLYAQFKELPSLETVTPTGLTNDKAYYDGNKIYVNLGSGKAYPYLVVTNTSNNNVTAPILSTSSTMSLFSTPSTVSGIDFNFTQTQTVPIPYANSGARTVIGWFNPYERNTVQGKAMKVGDSVNLGTYTEVGGEKIDDGVGLWAPTDAIGAFEKRGAVLLYNSTKKVGITDSDTSEKIKLTGADGRERTLYVVVDYKQTNPTPNNTYNSTTESFGTGSNTTKVTQVARDFATIYNIIAPVYGNEWGDFSSAWTTEAMNAVSGTSNGMFIPPFTAVSNPQSYNGTNGLVLYFTPLNYPSAPAVYFSFDNARLPINNYSAGTYTPGYKYTNQGLCFIINTNYIDEGKYSEILKGMAKALTKAIHTYQRVISKGYTLESNSIVQKAPGYDAFVEDMFESLAFDLVAKAVGISGPSNNDVSKGTYVTETSNTSYLATKGALVDYIANQRYDLLDYVPALSRPVNETSYGSTASGLGYSFGSYLVRNYGYKFIKEYHNSILSEYASTLDYKTITSSQEGANNRVTHSKEIIVSAINKNLTPENQITWDKLVRNWGVAVLLSADKNTVIPYKLNGNNTWITTDTTPTRQIPSLDYSAYYIYKNGTKMTLPRHSRTITPTTTHALADQTGLMYSSAAGLPTIGPYVYNTVTGTDSANYLYSKISGKEALKPNTNLFFALEGTNNSGTGIKTYTIPNLNSNLKYTVVLSNTQLK